jgi:hypothetical protein
MKFVDKMQRIVILKRFGMFGRRLAFKGKFM